MKKQGNKHPVVGQGILQIGGYHRKCHTLVWLTEHVELLVHLEANKLEIDNRAGSRCRHCKIHKGGSVQLEKQLWNLLEP